MSVDPHTLARIRSLEEEIALLEARRAAERDFLLRWILEAHRTLHRAGWEEGMTDAELSAGLSHVLANYGCDAEADEAQAVEASRILALPRRFAFEED